MDTIGDHLMSVTVDIKITEVSVTTIIMSIDGFRHHTRSCSDHSDIDPIDGFKASPDHKVRALVPVVAPWKWPPGVIRTLGRWPILWVMVNADDQARMNMFTVFGMNRQGQETEI